MNILKRLEEERVVMFRIEHGKFLNITEACDTYFELWLNKKEVGEFIMELTELRSQMK